MVEVTWVHFFPPVHFAFGSVAQRAGGEASSQLVSQVAKQIAGELMLGDAQT